MEQFKQFNAKKADVVASLKALQRSIEELSGLGLEVESDIIKVRKAIEDVQADALRIALLGAFSDGKTSVVAGWLGQVMNDMKIDTNESSDALAIYRPDQFEDKCEIVDTPGLFGDKEKAVSPGETVRYGDITKNYISEAHLIFYVVDATNPLKDSHQDIVRWVLRDLNKLSTTIFVINKMDEVADLRDAEEFDEQSEIKRKNLLDKVQRFVGLTPEERAALNVVCVASNPNGRGLDFWFDQRDTYELRSRIPHLKDVTRRVLDEAGRDTLVRKTGLDVIRDVLGKKINVAHEELSRLNLLAEGQRQDTDRIAEDLAEGRRKVSATLQDLYEQLTTLESALINSIRSLPREQITEFIEKEIGYSKNDVGDKLRFRINLLFSTAFERSANIMQGVGSKIEHQLTLSSEFSESITASALGASTKALNAVAKIPVQNIKDSIFLARETVKNLTGFVYKFKPWEATKLAGNISKWAGPVGAGVQLLTDLIGMVMQQQAESKLAQFRDALVDMVKEHFAEPLMLLQDNDRMLVTFAPHIAAFEEMLTKQRTSLQELQVREQKLSLAQDQLKYALGDAPVIDGEPRRE
jgi:GTPase SAR1 family protein